MNNCFLILLNSSNKLIQIVNNINEIKTLLLHLSPGGVFICECLEFYYTISQLIYSHETRHTRIHPQK